MKEANGLRSAAARPQTDQYFEVDFRTVIGLIKNSYKVVLITVALFLAVGVYYATTRPPTYLSSALIQTSDSGISDMLGGANSGFRRLGRYGQNASALQIALIQSPYVLGDVASRLGLDIRVSPIKSKKKQPVNLTVNYLDIPNVLLAKPLMVVAGSNGQYNVFTNTGEKIGSGLVGQLLSTDYFGKPFQIRVASMTQWPGAEFIIQKTPQTEVAASLSNHLDVSETAEGTGILKLSFSATSPERAQKILNVILTSLIEKNQQQKSEHMHKMIDFMSKQLPIYQGSVNKTENQLNQYAIKSGVFDVQSTGQAMLSNINALQNTLEDLKFKKMALLEKYTPLFPLVVSVSKKEAEVESKIDELQQKLKDLPKVTQGELLLKNNLKIQDQIYTNMQIKMQEAELMNSSTESGITVLTTASYPISPLSVKKWMYISASIVLGFITAFFAIFIKFLLAPVIDDPDEVESALNVAVVGILPFSGKQNRQTKMVKRGYKKHYLLSTVDSKEMCVESLRSMRTTIQMQLLEARDNVLAITSCSPGVGKSFISSNLAKLFTDLGKRVLLIDADLRLGKLHDVFGIFKMPGLSNYLNGTETDLSLIIQKGVVGTLDVMTTGAYPGNPAELLATDKFSTLIQLLKLQYDLIIFDTPPVLAVTDPVLLLRASQVNLMVLGVGKDHMKAALHVKRLFDRSNVTLTGLVFNHILENRPGFGAVYGGYHYGKYNYNYAYDK
ncbi:MAG: polysaccharide biosynthesis tyrosine autokinase [Coxiellaceae bacterium]|nr:polysaccharide biosynthesis tyrosine autokinase [Coxiellaceae bacterium]